MSGEGNVSSVKHGMYSKRYGLVHAKLGQRFASAYGHCNQLRRRVEFLLRQRHGSVSLMQQAKVQSLLRLEEGVRACEKMMAEAPGMTAEEVRTQRYAIGQWTLQRDSLLAELLDVKGKSDPFEALDDDAWDGYLPSDDDGGDGPAASGDGKTLEASGTSSGDDGSDGVDWVGDFG